MPRPRLLISKFLRSSHEVADTQHTNIASEDSEVKIAIDQFPSDPPAGGEVVDVPPPQVALLGDGGHSPNTLGRLKGFDIVIESGALILKLGKRVLGNFSFPGTDAAFDVALGIVKHVKTTKDNADTLNTLRIRMDRLCASIPSEPIDMSADSQKHFEEFKRDIASLLIPWAKWNKDSTMVKFVLADVNKARLEELSSCISRAVELLQVQLARGGMRSHGRQEKLLRDVDRKMESEALKRVLDKLPQKASYNDYRKRPVDVCHGKTCEAMLSKIRDWAQGTSGEPRIFWLSGLAGTGKSTISKTVAAWADDKGILGASYFFSRDVEELSNATLFMPYIAYHISKFDFSLRRHVAPRLVEESELLGKEITVQFKRLIEEPFRLTHLPGRPRTRMLIIIDALDECNDLKAVQIIIDLLATLAISNPHIRILFSSRPEAYIQHTFEGIQIPSFLVRRTIEDFVSNRDIEEYLRHGLSKLGQANWFSENEFNALVRNSGKLFIYASTAISFIGGGGALESPKERLETLLCVNQDEPSEDEPYKQLDDLYLCILDQAVGGDGGRRVDSKVMKRFRAIIGTIFLLRDPLSVSSLAEFLKEDEEHIWTMLKHLGSIIIIPLPNDRDSPPRFFHPSLPDFLTDSSRCTDKRFFVDAPRQEAYLFRRCLEIIIEGTVPSVEVKAKFFPVLRYACGHWASHLEMAPLGDTRVTEELDLFVNCHLLEWFKVARIFKLRDSGNALFLSIDIGHRWAVKSKCGEKLLDTFNLMNQSSRLLHQRLLEHYESTYDYVRYMRRIQPCFPGTRLAILTEIKEWATNPDAKTPNIFWLCGLAEAGKSAIAVSIADWANEKRILGGSFFFPPSADLWVVLCTMAHDLTFFDPSMRKVIVDALSNADDLKDQGPEVQFKRLIAGPLLHAVSWSHILLIIDGLEYCHKPQSLLTLFIKYLSGAEYSHIRILFIGLSTFERFRTKTSGSILNIILAVNCLKSTTTLAGWPNPHDFDSLVSNSGDTFLYAERAAQFIEVDSDNDNAHDPAERLRDWCDNHPNVIPFMERCYEHDITWNNIAMHKDIIQLVNVIAAIVLLRDPLPLGSLTSLLQMDVTSMTTTLQQIHPIIIYPFDPQTPPRPFHPSLRKYLTTGPGFFTSGPIREFFKHVDMVKEETLLCRRCVERLLEGLGHDMRMGINRNERESMATEEEAEKNYNRVIQYSCRYWATHLSKAEHGDSMLKRSVQELVQNRLLDLFEILSMLDLASGLVQSLRTAFEWFGHSSSHYVHTIEVSSSLVPASQMMQDCSKKEDEESEEIWTLMLLKEACQLAEDNQSIFANSSSGIWSLVLDLPRDSALRRAYGAIAAARSEV